jgi:hypothetical protein
MSTKIKNPDEQNSSKEAVVHRYSEFLTKNKRDEYGLIDSIDYKFNQDGTVNWRGMIQKEFLVPNRDAFKDKNINLKDIDISSLQDNQLLILLAGIKELAQIRGFSNVEYQVVQANPEYVAVKCSITWTPNFETSMLPVSFSALADAHLDNTKDFAKNFLMAIAENRAFIRCVRNFLKINIVGNDEMGKNFTVGESNTEDSELNSPAQPISLLKKTMNEFNITFEQIKQRAIQKEMDGAKSWTAESDIPPLLMFNIIRGIKAKNK